MFVIFSIETLLLLCILLLLTRYYIYRKWTVLKKLHIPHDPPSLLNFGNLRQALSDEIYAYDLDHKKKYGLIWGFYVLSTPRIVCHDLGILQQIFIKEFSTFPNRLGSLSGLNGPEMENGLLQVKDNKWKRIRKTMTPTFSTSKLKQMLGIANWCVDNTIVVFRKKLENGNGVFVAKNVFAGLSLDVICSAAFSTDVNSQDEMKAEPQISLMAKELIRTSLIDPMFVLGSLFPMFSSLFFKYSRRRPFFDFFNNVCRKIIKERGEDSSDVHNRVDLLQLMLESKVTSTYLGNEIKKGMTDMEIIGNSIVMILAGYETTSTVMSFLAYNLAQHPDVQMKLQTEIDEMFDKTNGSLDYDSMNSLQYLEMCINESIRLYTPVPRTIRTGIKEATLNGLTIPSGLSVVMPIYALCHDPEHWDDPMEFRPARMKNINEIHPMIFQPFGSGPRNCIGMRFALMEVKVAFCKILREFTFKPTMDTPDPPLKLKFNVTTIRSKVDFNLRVVTRQNKA